MARRRGSGALDERGLPDDFAGRNHDRHKASGSPTLAITFEILHNIAKYRAPASQPGPEKKANRGVRGGKKPAEKPKATRKAKSLFKMIEAASPAAKVLGQPKAHFVLFL